MTWRNNITQIIRQYNPNLTDIYEFGVYSGESVWDIQNLYNKANLTIKKFFCFDSFVGLPLETKEPIAQSCWNEGGFNACKKFKTDNVDDCINKIDAIIKQNADFNNTDLIYIPGFYNDVLVDDLILQHNMQPAAFVDLDADLYSSTYTALDFMCRNNLIQTGTILAYDDWGGTPKWKTCEDGESRAHKEICNKYNITTKLILQFGMAYPHVQTVFIVC